MLNPGAGDVRRRWPPHRFAAVGQALADDGWRVVVGGGPTDVDLAAEVVTALGRPATDLAGRVSLAGLLGVLARAELMVSNDTGPLHLAAAVGTPTVGIFWASNALGAAPLTRAWHRPVVAWDGSCPRCGVHPRAGGCGHDVSFVEPVPVEEVLVAARSLLPRTSRNGRGQRW